MSAPRVYVVAGATATGKTDVAERLAERVDGEVVGADSRQVFRELEIGTGKPSMAARDARPHHLFDLCGLGERVSAGAWVRQAAMRIAEIHSRGRPIVLVGGTGLYLRALRDGLSQEPPHLPEARVRVQERLAREGAGALHAELARVDPSTAARLAPTDAQRVGRALEVWEASGRPLSWWHAQRHAPGLVARWRAVELVLPPAALADRIRERTEAMWSAGMLEETAALVERGLEPALRALRAIGYEEALDRLSRALDRDAATERMNARTRRLAKRQRTWFRHQFVGERLDAGAVSTEALVERVLAEAFDSPERDH